jgi:thiol-disulfide isomerase/thioredoxin
LRRNTKRIVHILVILFASLWFGGACLHAAGPVTAIGNAAKSDPVGARDIPSIELPMPPDEQAKRYLGLSGTGNLKIGQIDAQVLIIQVYSFYCPHCQRSAAQVNDLYQMIQGRPDLKEKIKMIGIGVGNSVYEVDSYRKRYNVPFPLFPDLSTDISQRLGVKGTPTFIGLKVNDKGVREQFYFEEGGFQDIERFLNEIIRLSGLK